MNELQIFNSEEFGDIRTVSINDEPWFVASDICRALDIQNVTQAVQKLDDDERSMFNIGRQGNANCVNEYGLYSLVLASRKPEAKKFKRWITHEVIPSIRKHGGYIAGQEKMSDDELIAKALIVAHSKIAEKQMQIESLTKEIGIKDQVIGELKPKADYTDRILKNPGLVTITQIAKDYGMSAIEMNKKLHELGVQYKQSDQWMLYSRYHAMGYTHSETVDIVRADGRSDIKMNTKWTQKGRLFLYNLLKQNGELPLIERGAK